MDMNEVKKINAAYIGYLIYMVILVLADYFKEIIGKYTVGIVAIGGLILFMFAYYKILRVFDTLKNSEVYKAKQKVLDDIEFNKGIKRMMGEREQVGLLRYMLTFPIAHPIGTLISISFTHAFATKDSAIMGVFRHILRIENIENNIYLVGTSMVLCYVFASYLFSIKVKRNTPLWIILIAIVLPVTFIITVITFAMGLGYGLRVVFEWIASLISMTPILVTNHNLLYIFILSVIVILRIAIEYELYSIRKVIQS